MHIASTMLFSFGHFCLRTVSCQVFSFILHLKVLSNEMVPAEIMFMRKAFIKEQVGEF